MEAHAFPIFNAFGKVCQHCLKRLLVINAAAIPARQKSEYVNSMCVCVFVRVRKHGMLNTRVCLAMWARTESEPVDKSAWVAKHQLLSA